MRGHSIRFLFIPLLFTITLLLPANGEPGQATPVPRKSDQEIKQHVEFQKKIWLLAEKKAYVQALDLLEAQYEKNAKDDFIFMSEFMFATQEKVMSVLYEKAGQLERGVDFLIKNRMTGKEGKYKFEETLFDLAIKARRLDVAQSVATSEKNSNVEKLFYNAQLQGARGNVEECLRLTREYLRGKET